MTIQTKVLRTDQDMDLLNLPLTSDMDIDLAEVSGVGDGEEEGQCILFMPGYYLVIQRDFEQTRLEWLESRKKS